MAYKRHMVISDGTDQINVMSGGAIAARIASATATIWAVISSTASPENKVLDEATINQLIADAQSGLGLSADLILDTATNNYNVIAYTGGLTYHAYALDTDYKILFETSPLDESTYTYWLFNESDVSGVQIFVIDDRVGLTIGSDYDFDATHRKWSRQVSSSLNLTPGQLATLNSGLTSADKTTITNLPYTYMPITAFSDETLVATIDSHGYAIASTITISSLATKATSGLNAGTIATIDATGNSISSGVSISTLAIKATTGLNAGMIATIDLYGNAISSGTTIVSKADKAANSNSSYVATINANGNAVVSGETLANLAHKITSGPLGTVDFPDIVHVDGDGTSFLADDGSYKSITVAGQQQSDWAETDTSAVTFIKNKPTIPDVSNKVNIDDDSGSTQIRQHSSDNTILSTIDLTQSAVSAGQTFTVSKGPAVAVLQLLSDGSSGEARLSAYDSGVLYRFSVTTQGISANSGQIHDTADPTNPQDVATKNYVDTTAPAAQVQADWSKTPSTSDISSILNRPTLADVATSGSYNDLQDKPPIPAAQVQADWTESSISALSYIKNKPILATVATSGSYNDLSDQPPIPAAQIQSDWTQSVTTALDYIKNKPTLADVATTGSYNDLQDKPTIPAAQIQSDWDQTDSTAVDYIQHKPTIPAAQIQSDWNQTNSSAVDYIQNKPDLPGTYVVKHSDDTSGRNLNITNANGDFLIRQHQGGWPYEWNNELAFNLSEVHFKFHREGDEGNFGTTYDSTFQAEASTIGLRHQFAVPVDTVSVVQDLYLESGYSRPRYKITQPGVQLSFGNEGDTRYIPPTIFPAGAIEDPWDDGYFAGWLFSRGYTSVSSGFECPDTWRWDGYAAGYNQPYILYSVDGGTFGIWDTHHGNFYTLSGVGITYTTVPVSELQDDVALLSDLSGHLGNTYVPFSKAEANSISDNINYELQDQGYISIARNGNFSTHTLQLDINLVNFHGILPTLGIQAKTVNSNHFEFAIGGRANGQPDLLSYLKDPTTAPDGMWSFNGLAVHDVLDPVLAQDAATKNYVDTATADLSNKVNILDTSGVTQIMQQSADGTISSVLNLTQSSSLAVQSHVVSKGNAEGSVQIMTDGTEGGVNLGASNTSTGANVHFIVSTQGISASNNRLQDVADPTGAQDAATKNYVDTGYVPWTRTRSVGTFTDEIVLTDGSASVGLDRHFEYTADGTDMPGFELFAKRSNAGLYAHGDFYDDTYFHFRIGTDGLGDLLSLQAGAGSDDASWTFHNTPIHEVPDPVEDQDPATKNYVDTTVSGVTSSLSGKVNRVTAGTVNQNFSEGIYTQNTDYFNKGATVEVKQEGGYSIATFMANMEGGAAIEALSNDYGINHIILRVYGNDTLGVYGDTNGNVSVSLNNYALHAVADPTLDQDAATKHYVDTGLGNKVNVSDTSGSTTITQTNGQSTSTLKAASLSLTQNASQSEAILQAQGTIAVGGTYYSLVDLVGSGAPSLNIGVKLDSAWQRRITISATGISVNSSKISDVTNPTAAQDAATKAYVDAVDAKISTAATSSNPALDQATVEQLISEGIAGVGVIASLSFDADTNNYNIIDSDATDVVTAYAIGGSAYEIIAKASLSPYPTTGDPLYQWCVFSVDDVDNVPDPAMLFVLDDRSTLNIGDPYDFAVGHVKWQRGKNGVMNLTEAQQDALDSTATLTKINQIGTNTADIATNAAAISANTSAISANASAIATNTANIATNTTNISTNTTNIATNTANIATNTSAISALSTTVGTNTANIATNTSAISALSTTVGTNTSNIATNTADIATNAANIATNTSAITTINTTLGNKVDKITSTGISVYAHDGVNQTGITIDSSPASGSTNLISSGAVYTAISAIDTSGKVDKITSTGISVYAHNGATQNSITIDSAPATGSTNLISSGAVYTALAGKVAISTSGTTLKVYSHTGSTESQTDVSNAAAANAIAQYQSTGALTVGTPSANTDATTKTYVDTALASKADTSSVANKVDKVTTGTTLQAYTHTGASESQTGISSNATGSTIAMYQATGALTVGTPSANTDATTKTYVDTAVGAKADKATGLTAASNKTLISYNADGIVTGSGDAGISNITGLQAALDAKLAIPTQITAVSTATFLKVAYNTNGLITASAAVTASDIPDLAISKITNLQTTLDGKVNTPTQITAVSTPTFLKVAYDTNGFITSSATVAATDIPALPISKITNLQTELDGKMTGNAAITAQSTQALYKITYDAKGLITGGATVTESDLPSISISKITNLQTTLDGKVSTPTQITAVSTVTFLKVAYNTNGFITSSAAVTASDIPDLAISKITNLQTTLDGKATASTITAASTAVFTKIAYSAQGVITGVASVTASDIPDLAISKITNLQSSLDAKLAIPTQITAVATPALLKVAYDANGLITSSVAVALDDLPDYPISKVENLQEELDNKMNANPDLLGFGLFNTQDEAIDYADLNPGEMAFYPVGT